MSKQTDKTSTLFSEFCVQMIHDLITLQLIL
jgi:hypothetical protein